ncbi:hypothetical protein BH09GEM1_BH09GEM1_24880 [soil metagenome]
MAPPATVPMRSVALIAALVSVALGSRAAPAQVREVANEETMIVVRSSASRALAAWEDALVDQNASADAWSGIGRRLHVVGRYRECIAALERSLVIRGSRSREDDQFIADAYWRLGNTKQAMRWSGGTRRVARPESRRSSSPRRWRSISGLGANMDSRFRGNDEQGAMPGD